MATCICRSRYAWCAIIVEDQGIGMPAAVVAQLREQFVRPAFCQTAEWIGGW